MPAPHVTLITDGSALRNPGPGGWAAILIAANGTTVELTGGAAHTTNNRMEISALLEGLRALNRPCTVRVVADSKYVIDSTSKWMRGWKRRGWIKSDGAPVLNADLWQQIDALQTEMRHILTWEWVRGHNGHSLNERADALARSAAEAQRDALALPAPATS